MSHQVVAHDGTSAHVKGDVWTYVDHVWGLRDMNASPRLLTNSVVGQENDSIYQTLSSNMQRWPPTPTQTTYSSLNTSPTPGPTATSIFVSFDDSESSVFTGITPAKCFNAGECDNSSPITAMVHPLNHPIDWYPTLHRNMYDAQLGTHGEISVHANNAIWRDIDRAEGQDLLWANSVTAQEINAFNQTPSSSISDPSFSIPPPMPFDVTGLVQRPYGPLAELNLGNFNAGKSNGVTDINSPSFSTVTLDGITWHICSCRYRTNKIGTMKRHCDSLRHSKEKKYACSKCFKRFTRDDGRKRHEKYCQKEKLTSTRHVQAAHEGFGN